LDGSVKCDAWRFGRVQAESLSGREAAKQTDVTHKEGNIAMKRLLLALTVMGLVTGANAADAPKAGNGMPPMPPNPVSVDPDGTVNVPAISIPVSEYLSPEGKAYLTEHLNVLHHPESLAPINGVPAFLAHYLERQRVLFPVHQSETSIASVHAYVYTPKNGLDAKNTKRVLINLHGGGFMGCWPACGELESIPIAALGGFKVVSLDYREGPKYQFPAASEDVAAVYKELLKTYPAGSIGIYGCSAGGMLTGMSVAWFQKHNLPMPGAIGIFCAGLTVSSGFGGDANYISAPAGEGRLMGAPPKPVAGGKPAPGSVMPYLANADLKDPLVSPGASMDVVAKFPPTLIITGTRGFELSSAVYSHSLLVKAGVEADLHVWEGLFHGFFYNPDVPESRDCYDVIVKFFDRHIGK
jgi:acetyl esterase/lipase